MNNLRDLEVQARTLESAGQHAAALELYERILEEPAGQREGGTWVRKARVHLALSQQREAAESYATAAERYESMGLANLALAQSQRAQRVDSSRPESFLRSARLAASLGYARDARNDFLAYADRALAADDEAAAVAALREYLAFFPKDEAVRARVTQLAGDAPPSALASSLSEARDEDLTRRSGVEVWPDAVPQPDAAIAAARDEEELAEPSEEVTAGVPQVEPLEGFEPTHVEEHFEELESSDVEKRSEERSRVSIEEEPRSDLIDDVSDPTPFASRDPEAEENPEEDEGRGAAELEPLPLLGLEPDPDPPMRAEAPAEHAEAPVQAPASPSPAREYVDLGELILSAVPEQATRFQVAALEPTGDEESDFEEILNLFRQKISRSLDPKDSASHYDLGLAFKEMGLLDDAIVHLQSGLRGGASPLATLEVLGECFVMKGQTSLAARVFERATRLEGVSDSDLVGVLYGLARCQEEMGQREEARGTYERIVAVDLSFRDAAQRLERLQSR